MAKTNVRKATFFLLFYIAFASFWEDNLKTAVCLKSCAAMLSNTPPFCLAILTLASFFWVKRKKRKPMGGFQDA